MFDKKNSKVPSDLAMKKKHCPRPASRKKDKRSSKIPPKVSFDSSQNICEVAFCTGLKERVGMFMNFVTLPLHHFGDSL
jgi:hypothetical protein